MHSKIWMVRAGEGSYLIEDFLREGIVAIGWNEIGRLQDNISYGELKERFKNAYPEDSEGRVRQCVGQIGKFLFDFKVGDRVVTYDSSAREYYTGTITSKYSFGENREYHHYRQVEWVDGGIPRDALSPETKNTLGAISTIFELTESILEDLETNHPGYLSPDVEAEIQEISEHFERQQLEELKNNVKSRSNEFIKDIIANLSWQDTEQLVAGILRCLGYKTRMTSRGGDLGSDIIASPDELGLEEPIIKVEVKKRSKDKIGANEVRSFIGGMRGFNKGIYVTTSGFTKEAMYESERANFAITLIDSDWLVELLVSNYDKLDPEAKALVPLRKIYWPV